VVSIPLITAHDSHSATLSCDCEINYFFFFQCLVSFHHFCLKDTIQLYYVHNEQTIKAETVIGLMVKISEYQAFLTMLTCSRQIFILAIFEFEALPLVRKKFMLQPLGDMCNEKSN